MNDFYSAPVAEQARRMAVLAQAALGRWGLEAQELELVKYRENAVFKVSTADAQFALRIHRAGYHSDAELRSELQWMQALLSDGFAVPVLVPSRSGALFESVAVDGVPEPRQTDLFIWCSGTPLGSVEQGMGGSGVDLRRTFRTIGVLAARLHEQAVRWAPPAGFVRHAWDAGGLVGEQPYWGRFWDLAALGETERRLILQTRDAARVDLAALTQEPAVYGLIHADFCPENLLVDGEQIRLLDFDDAGYGWHLFEMATSLYFVRPEAHFPEVEAALIAGYGSLRPLDPAMLRSLPLFYAVRGLTYLGWVHTRQETETARGLTPTLIALACDAAERYLSTRDAGSAGVRAPGPRAPAAS
ncbi:MAG: phosphotransferase [Gammaproteobacteria bacterium]|nr:phosphotransferase [Gammaproteobacteria bacterium]